MAGSYNGPIHNGGPLTGSFFDNTEKLKRIGQQNAIRLAKKTGKAVVSADGKRLLAEAPRPDPRDHVVVGSGPGVASVGRAPSAGPGLGVVTTFTPNATVVMPGPGAMTVGAAPTTGPGVIKVGAVNTSGPAASGVVMAGSGRWFSGPELSVGLQQNQEATTSIKFGGVWLQPSPLFSDAEHAEVRYGDDGPVMWALSLGVFAADVGNTVGYGLREHVLGDINRATKDLKPVPGGVWGGGSSPFADAWPPPVAGR